MNDELTTRELVLSVGALLAAVVFVSPDVLIGVVWAAGLVVVLYVVGPLQSLMHELGHGIVATAGTSHRALIQMGDPPFTRRFALGRCDVEWGSARAIGYPGVCHHPEMTARRNFATTLAGPLVDVSLGIALLVAGLQIQAPTLLSVLILLSAALWLFTAAAQLRPYETEEGMKTDGRQILDHIRDWRRWTRGTHRTVGAATEAAASRACGHVGTEHLLLGLLQADGAISGALRDHGVTPDNVQAAIDAGPPRDPTDTSPPLPLTPAARRMLTTPGRARIAPEHVLLALADDKDTLAMDVLLHLEVDVAALRQRARTLLGD